MKRTQVIDPLESDFRELEREVRQRNCGHNASAEITTISDDLRRFVCIECGRQWSEGVSTT